MERATFDPLDFVSRFGKEAVCALWDPSGASRIIVRTTDGISMTTRSYMKGYKEFEEEVQKKRRASQVNGEDQT